MTAPHALVAEMSAVVDERHPVESIIQRQNAFVLGGGDLAEVRNYSEVFEVAGFPCLRCRSGFSNAALRANPPPSFSPHGHICNFRLE